MKKSLLALGLGLTLVAFTIATPTHAQVVSSNDKATIQAALTPPLAQTVSMLGGYVGFLAYERQIENTRWAIIGNQVASLNVTLNTLRGFTVPESIKPTYDNTINATSQYVGALGAQAQAVQARQVQEVNVISGIIQSIGNVVSQIV